MAILNLRGTMRMITTRVAPFICALRMLVFPGGASMPLSVEADTPAAANVNASHVVLSYRLTWMSSSLLRSDHPLAGAKN
jgi:hypothetical protein